MYKQKNIFMHFYKTFVVLEFVYNSHLSASLWRKKSSAVQFVLIFWQVWRKVKSAFLYRIETKTKSKYSKQFCPRFVYMSIVIFHFWFNLNLIIRKSDCYLNLWTKMKCKLRYFLEKCPKLKVRVLLAVILKKTIRSKQNLRNGNLPPFIMLSISRCFRTMNAVLKNEFVFLKGSINSPDLKN